VGQAAGPPLRRALSVSSVGRGCALEPRIGRSVECAEPRAVGTPHRDGLRQLRERLREGQRTAVDAVFPTDAPSWPNILRVESDQLEELRRKNYCEQANSAHTIAQKCWARKAKSYRNK
jgi:hypothetical protein